RQESEHEHVDDGKLLNIRSTSELQLRLQLNHSHGSHDGRSNPRSANYGCRKPAVIADSSAGIVAHRYAFQRRPCPEARSLEPWLESGTAPLLKQKHSQMKH